MSRKPITPAQLSEAKTKVDQATARYRDLKAQHKSLQRRDKKKRDDQRKILAGAWVLSAMQKDADFKAVALAGIDKFLTRAIDRAAFPELK